MQISSDTGVSAHAITEKLRETPKLSINRVPVLNTMIERLATHCVEGLRDFCSVPMSAFVNHIEIRDSWELLRENEDSIAVVFYSPEWDARILVGIERRFIFSVIEIMYGGENTEPPFGSDRPFTLLETRVGRTICEMAARSLETGFAGIADITLQTEKTESTLEFTALGQANMTVVSTQIMFNVADRGGNMFILIPQTAIYPIRQKLEKERTVSPSASDPWWARKMRHGIAQTEMTIEAILEVVPMDLYDVANIKVGQILELKTNDKNIIIESADQRLFRGHIGEEEGKFTVTLDYSINEQEELFEDILAGAIQK